MKNQAAFPSPGVVIPSGPGSATTPYQQGAYEGMTLRDYFAAKAMQALMDEWVRNTDSFDSIEGEPAEFGKNRTPRQSPNSAKCWISSRGCRIICDMQR